MAKQEALEQTTNNAVQHVQIQRVEGGVYSTDNGGITYSWKNYSPGLKKFIKNSSMASRFGLC